MCGISILSVEKVRSTLSDFRDLQERSENASSVDTCTRQHDRASRRFARVGAGGAEQDPTKNRRREIGRSRTLSRLRRVRHREELREDGLAGRALPRVLEQPLAYQVLDVAAPQQRVVTALELQGLARLGADEPVRGRGQLGPHAARRGGAAVRGGAVGCAFLLLSLGPGQHIFRARLAEQGRRGGGEARTGRCLAARSRARTGPRAAGSRASSRGRTPSGTRRVAR